MPDSDQPQGGQGSREHGSLSDSREREIVVTSGIAGAAASALKIAAGLSIDKILTLFVVTGFGWMLFTTFQTVAADKQNDRRMYDDARERDRQHCSNREDKIARDAAAEAEKMRSWYAAQAENQRRFESDQREKERITVAELARVIAMKLQARPNADP